MEGDVKPLIAGNLPTEIRYKVQNPDGSISTIRTISIGTENGEVLIPTVIDGKIVEDDEAIRHFKQTGENFGTFRTPDEATAYANYLHNLHANELKPHPLDAGAANSSGPKQIVWPIRGGY